MAVITTGSIVADIRGSVGDETYARNQGGLYVKARKAPTDPNTAAQQACRAAMAALSQYWSDELTEQNRTDWRAYAHQHPRPNRFGSVNLTNGYTRFLRLNFTRRRLDATIPFTSPPPAPPLHPPVVSGEGDASAQELTIFLPPTNYDPPFAGLELFLYISPDVPPGRNFYNGPWLYFARTRNVPGWTNDFQEMAIGAGYTGGHKLFFRLVAQNYATGELSSAYQNFVLLEA